MECSRAIFLARSVMRIGALSRMSHRAQLSPAIRDMHHPKLGNRDIVGYGWNGTPSYMDRPEFPCPAVRYGENSKEVLALREKEKGNWKSLSLEEKKKLYRASFRKTFAEMSAPTGEWKAVMAIVLFGMSVAGCLSILVKKFLLPEMPHSITREWQEKQLELMVKQRQGPVGGVSSHWDYEKNEWK